MTKFKADDLSKFCIETASTYRYVCNHILEMQAEIYYLKDTINKAIEYIEHNSKQLEDEEMNVTYGIGDDFYLDELLNILKGSDSNDNR